MTLFTNDTSGITPSGTTVTTGNSGGASGTAWNTVVINTTATAATLVSDNTTPPTGLTLWQKYTRGNTAKNVYTGWTDTGATSYTLSFWFMLDTYPSATVQGPVLIRGGGGDLGSSRLQVGATGLVSVVGASTVATSSSTLALNTVYWMRMYASAISTTVAGPYALDVYNASGTLYYSISGTGLAAQANAEQAHFGVRSSATMGNFWMGGFQLNIGSSTPFTFPSTVSAGWTNGLFARIG